MKISQIVFPAKERAALVQEEFDATPAPNDLVVRMVYSAISAGTELANYHALPNTGPTGYRGMEDGDTIGGYPFFPGYSAAGIVEAVGAEVKGFQVGDKVATMRIGHVSMFRIRACDAVKIPDGLDLKEAAFAYITLFPFLGVRKLQLELGESCMVAGLGILGLISIQLAKLSGAFPVLGCDFSAERRAKALELGADFVFNPADPDFVEQVKAATEGRGPAGVVEVTGRIEALQQALEYIDWQGRITLLGCTRISDKSIDFYKYVHKRGIVMIGCHTATRPQVDSRPGQWTDFDDFKTSLKLMKAGRLQVKPFINIIASPADADEIYHEIGFSKNPPFGVVFDWSKI